jgi:hypothetical protein
LLPKVWNRWKAIAQIIGDFQARVILTLFYFIILTPGGLIIRSFSDPLRLKHPHRASMWTLRSAETQSLGEARKQY